MATAPKPPASLEFGRFVLVPHRRELLADGHPLKLGGRAFDVLVALTELRGVVVSKGTLMERVWPGRIVDENALQAQISALRAAFGPESELIRTVSGRGYQFIGEVRVLAPSAHEDTGAGVVAKQPPSSQPNEHGGRRGFRTDRRG